MRKILSVLVVGLFLFTGSLAMAGEGGKPKIANYKYGMNFMIPTGDKATAGFLMILSEKLLLELDLGFGWQVVRRQAVQHRRRHGTGHQVDAQ
jgi:hypothetical protein